MIQLFITPAGVRPEEESLVPKNNTTGIIFVNPNEYFQGAVSGAVANLRLQVSEHAQHYLVSFWANLSPPKFRGLPIIRANPRHTHSTACPGIEQERAEQKAARLRQLGDYSLYVAGFFSDSSAASS